MVSQASLLVAVQLQPEPAVTVIEPLIASHEVRFTDAGVSVIEHGRAACVTVNVWSPIVNVPVRDVVPLLTATL